MLRKWKWVTDQSFMCGRLYDNISAAEVALNTSHAAHTPSGTHTHTASSFKGKTTITDALKHAACQAYTHTAQTLASGIKAMLPHLINSEDGLSRPWHGVHSAPLRQHLS